ncbi:MAG: hypothetical protein GXP58_04230 [Deltaproteobacteria bacterium]|nr:hypothetical protein [Deltaproteobacteria bacterium]
MASNTKKRKAIQARKAAKLARQKKSDVVTVASRRRSEKEAAVNPEK